MGQGEGITPSTVVKVRAETMGMKLQLSGPIAPREGGLVAAKSSGQVLFCTLGKTSSLHPPRLRPKVVMRPKRLPRLLSGSTGPARVVAMNTGAPLTTLPRANQKQSSALCHLLPCGCIDRCEASLPVSASLFFRQVYQSRHYTGKQISLTVSLCGTALGA